MAFQGGTRDRAVHQSTFNFLKDHFTALGWFDSGRAHQPINFIAGRPKQASETTVPINTVVLVDEEVESKDFEMGTEASEDKYQFTVEMYAENEAVGRALMGDVRKLVSGQFPGRSIYPIIDLYDYSQDPAVYVSYMDVTDVKWSHPTSKELYQRFWFKVEFAVTDYTL